MRKANYISLKILSSILGYGLFLWMIVSYILALKYGQVPFCMPLIDGCTSISQTGEQAPASVVYRALILPLATVMLFFWVLYRQWHLRLDSRSRWAGVCAVLGIVAGVGLIVAESLLQGGDLWWQLHVLNAGIAILFTGIAQLLAGILFWHLLKIRYPLWISAAFFLIPAVEFTPWLNSNSGEWWSVALIAIWYISVAKVFTIAPKSSHRKTPLIINY